MNANESAGRTGADSQDVLVASRAVGCVEPVNGHPHPLQIDIRSPMAPLTSDTIPAGAKWGYQLKWDGVRMLASVQDGQVQLYSRKLMKRNEIYPEVIAALQAALVGHHDLVLDGEVVIFDPEAGRPVFQLVLQRERMRGPGRGAGASRAPEAAMAASTAGTISPGAGANGQPLIRYVLFDLLYVNGTDLRPLPYAERHQRLLGLFPDRLPHVFVADLFSDGQALWEWIQQHKWEGMVSKRLDSAYAEDKQHQDWFKKKTSVIHQVNVIGVLLRDERVASLVMEKQGRYFGNVSLGLDEQMRITIRQWIRPLQEAGMDDRAIALVEPMPKLSRNETIIWLPQPIPCLVTGQEVTAGGMLRHPKIHSHSLQSGKGEWR